MSTKINIKVLDDKVSEHDNKINDLDDTASEHTDQTEQNIKGIQSNDLDIAQITAKQLLDEI
ncbi:MAG: hypothetical protein Ta2E_11290 [Mycoplasmoidaceae bacterium]|nr:MAG: hypothetical protein Ta2E_11290 [Mycoplasmoidaceae bacterium]